MNNPENVPWNVVDNHFNLFYFFAEAIDPATLQAGDLTLPLPDRLLPALQHPEIAEVPVWSAANYTLHGDFLPNLHALFRSGDQQAVHVWDINSHILKLLNGSLRLVPGNQGVAPLQLTQILRKLAGTRVALHHGKEENPLLEIKRLRYFGFKSGFGIALVDVSLKNPALSSVLMQESLYSLARFNQLAWHEKDADSITTSTSMGQLIRGLLGQSGGKSFHRVFSHAFVQLNSSHTVTDADTLALHLARHYTMDYQLSGDTGESVYLTDFANVRHCIANEGVASVVLANEDSPEFVRDYYNKVTLPVHVPICLMNIHAEQAIQHYMACSSIWLGDTLPMAGELAPLQQQQQALLNFDMHFFYPVISKINTHNRLHRAMMKIKYLDEQHAIVSRTTTLFNGLVAADQKKQESEKNQRRNKIFCWVAPLGAAAAGYLTAFSIVSEAQDVLLGEWLDKTSVAAKFLHHWDGSISLSSALFVALLAWFFSHRTCGKGTGNEGHAILGVAEIAHISHLIKKRKK